MKKFLYILSISLFILVNKANAQQDQTVIEEDTFTYKRLDVTNKEDGTLSIKGGKASQKPKTEAAIESRNSNSGIGETPGNLSVSLTGGANYEIPFEVPPGINGIVPEISLGYNSQAGNGLAGYGWNLRGVSSITRIPSSKFHDDEMDAVDFDNLDRFALDGERLVLKSGTYGADGAQYETERYSNLKITSHGTSSYGSSYGPSYFTVKYPDGSTAYYGNNSNSTSRLSYSISYWQNPHGIRISYEYIGGDSKAIYKIKYGSLGTATPINEIQFNYGTRNRLEQSYVNDISIVRSRILKSVESYSNGVRYRRYGLSHDSSDRTTLEYERLSRVTEASGDNSEFHSSIIFSYPDSDSSISYNGLTTDLGLNNIEQRNAEVVPLDMTGNGKMDFIAYPKSPKNKFWMFSDIQSGGYNYPYEVNTGTFEAIFPTRQLNYQNKVLSGQGLTVVQKSGNQVRFKVYSKAPPSAGGIPLGYDYTKIWNGPTYSYASSPTSSTQRSIPMEYLSGDFDGDGLTDVLAIGKPYTSRSCYYHGDCDDPDPCPDDQLISVDDPCLNVFQRSSGQLEETKDIDKNHNKNRKITVDESLEISKPFDVETYNKNLTPVNNNCPYSCYSYTSNYKSAYLINLRRDISSGFSSHAGHLQLHLSGNYVLRTGDFNGDGKTDLLHIINGKLYVYTLDSNNNLSLLWQLTDSDITTTAPPMMGDFNGDGKTDLMDPEANNSSLFNMYISTGTRFVKGSYSQPFTYRQTNWNGNNGVLSGYNLVPLDVNGDGKTDIIEYNTVTYNDSPFPWIPTPDGTQTIKIYNNLRINNSSLVTRIRFDYGGTASKTGNLKHFPIPVFLTSSQPNKNLDFASISNKWVTNFSFTHDHREDVLLKSITNNGVKYEIDYNNLDPSQYNSEFYTQVYQEEHDQVYPYIDLKIAPSTKVVSAFRRFGYLDSGTVLSKRVFAYKGGVYNAEGLGFLGFSAIAQSNWHTGNSDRIFTVSKYDSNLRGAMVENYSMRNYFSFYTPTSNYISKTTNQYSSSLSSNKVFKLWMDSSFNQNDLQGTYTNTTYQYDIYNNPTTISATYMGGSKTQNITYSNNTSFLYHVGRPINTTITTTIGSETFSTEQQFIYAGYLLAERKIKGNGTPFNVVTYQYDGAGNIIRETTTPNGESPREIEFEYDPSRRFIVKSTNVEDLETTYQYDVNTGNLTKEISPFNQETTYEYDPWNIMVKTTDYLGKVNTTDYTEVNNAYTVTNSADDGSEMVIEYDQLQRVSVIKEKNVLGAWINKKYEYDALNRLIKESEPYSGNSPSQWNEVTYDGYSRPISQTLYTGRVINISYNNLTTTVDDSVKTVTSVRNQFGNIASVTDPGGTINYTYYGNGNLKTSNYNGVVISTEQDGWGRKTKLIDPSAGSYEYEYNGFGELLNETTPKGSTDYVYSTTGRLISKSISGDNTPNTTINYSYNPTHKYIDAISLSSADGNNSTYTYAYDSYIRLTSFTESNSYAEFTKQLTYDDFGRVDTEEYYGKLLSNGKTSTKKVKNVYQNGVLKTIKDFNTNNNIWNATGVNSRGQLTSASIGNNVINSRSYDSYGYLTNTLIAKNTGTSSQILMQLDTDFDAERGTLNSRSNSMFSWSETFEYDNLDRLISFDDNNGDNHMTYDDYGRITFNNTVGDYNYSGTSYQVANIDLNNQGDIYYQQNRLEQVKYNAFKKPFELSEIGKEKIGFQYNAFMGRSHMFYGDEETNILDRNNRKHYSHDSSMEISYDEDEDKTLFVTYIGGDAYSAPAIWRSESTSSINESDYYYLHRDYLGSILLITDGNGNAKEKRHFDAWGKTVKIEDGSGNTLDKLTFLDRGYTGHEHLQGVNLIHMNGRLYDPNLKRFLSPDNFIQNPFNTQNYNRYGYVLNNPLKYVDPSGETYNDTETGGLSGGEQVGLGALIASAGAWIANNWSGIDKWTTKNIFRPIQKFFKGIGKLQPGRWIKGWFKKRSKPPVEYSNYQGLSSDPLAGTSMVTSVESFNAGGANNGDLGVVKELTEIERMVKKAGYSHTYRGPISFNKNTINDLINKIPELKHMYEFHGELTKDDIYVSDTEGNLYRHPHHYININPDSAFQGWVDLVDTLFHESLHAFQYRSGYVDELKSLFNIKKPFVKFTIVDDILEVQAYNYAWGLGGPKDPKGVKRYNRHVGNIRDYISNSNNASQIRYLREILNSLNQ
ncbi:RHS repeat-associated core domain-containing protein [uncultured Winogradskyella sp.]|uniref:RHS repeat-associated core domain-containing protein n=1 Tax=uncultured Winogradskyella sp. TaxID=395353 RepID=UPI002625A983|nr:RHS repeat-associated core domain-containing protein [uncultured Winogradskyella sp.]